VLCSSLFSNATDIDVTFSDYFKEIGSFIIKREMWMGNLGIKKKGSIYKVQYTSPIVQLLADSTPLGSVINKLEEAVICWWLAFKASRKNKRQRTFILFTTEHTKHSAL
jgi:hypothetical protein